MCCAKLRLRWRQAGMLSKISADTQLRTPTWIALSLPPQGYGDVVLPSEWRILGPLEGIVGLILFYLQ